MYNDVRKGVSASNDIWGNGSTAPELSVTSRTPGIDAGREALPDLICLSHLRWDFVYQRPQHLLGRCARERRVFFVEEPLWETGPARMEITRRAEGVWVAVPHLPEVRIDDADRLQQQLLDEMIREQSVRDYALWYYTPMALGFTRHLEPRAVVYDCMDELSLFRGAPRALVEREAELMRRADVVFTGGPSLYEAKRDRHQNIHAFPSRIDRAHFARARRATADPADQASIPHPRLGFFGVIDERMDLDLLAGLADSRPDWHLVMIGPVVKIDPVDLPVRPNIHYLGGRQYAELPDYIAGWDVALLPFAQNESTRFISPTKTPEYLAAGRPVVSTPIRDVVRPYAENGLVRIAGTVPEFVTAVEAALNEDVDDSSRLEQVDRFLASMSWDRTWTEMAELLGAAVEANTKAAESTVSQRTPAEAAPTTA